MSTYKQKMFVFYVFHNTCTRNSHHLILFIKIGDAHKIKILSETIFNTSKKCNPENGRNRNIVKNDGGGVMAIVFAITEINYLVVGLFSDLVRAILYLYLWY